MSSHTTLRAVHELLSDPRKWTRGALARTAEGTETYPRSPNAVAWCLIGALEACAPDLVSYWAARSALVAEVARRAPGTGMPRFNDTTTHEELLSVIDEALRRTQLTDR